MSGIDEAELRRLAANPSQSRRRAASPPRPRTRKASGLPPVSWLAVAGALRGAAAAAVLIWAGVLNALTGWQVVATVVAGVLVFGPPVPLAWLTRYLDRPAREPSRADGWLD